MQKSLAAEQGFLALPEAELTEFDRARVVIQQVPYEYSSSYISGSDKGPAAIIEASHFVEYYDEEVGTESYKDFGICTLEALDFTGKVDKEAVDLIEAHTDEVLNAGKFCVSLGAEHTVTYGLVKSHAKKHPGLSVLQIDAHSDLREAYQGNPYSHASVMARVHSEGINLVQVGIRAQCIEEAQLIQSSDNIHTWYAHMLHDEGWMDRVIDALGEEVYVTIDADGFDPSIVPAVGTAEPAGLTWHQGTQLLKKLCERRKVVGFDIVEIAPREVDIITEFTMAKLCYRFLGYLNQNKQL